MKSNKLVLLPLLLLGLNNTANAGGLEKFMKYASQKGSMTSYNAGGSISDQKAGHFVGGSMLRRGPRPEELQPLSINLPSASFDPCTGSFDLRLGGFSYIKGKQLTKYFKSVATNAGSYVAMMLVKQQCPQCSDIMSDLESIARDVNGTTFDACEQGKAIAEGVMGKFNSADQQKCLVKSSVAKKGDLFESTQQCQDDPSTHGETGDNDELKSMLPDNYNLVWKALSHGDRSASTGMKELMMSISGSIIGKKDGDTPTISSLPSLIDKEDLLERYIGKAEKGVSKVPLYVCDSADKCLEPKVQITEIADQKDTLHGKVKLTLTSILNKIEKNKGEMDDEEQALIEFSAIPIISLLENELALRGKDSVSSFDSNPEFIEVICYDMITNFMNKMLAEAKAAVDELSTAQLDNTPIERFNKNAENIQMMLRDKRYLAMKKLQTILAVHDRLSRQQEVFLLGFSRFSDN